MDKKAEILSITHYSDRYPVSACFIDEETHYVISSVDFVQTDRIFYDLYSLYGTSPFSGYQTQEYAPLVYHIDENGFIGVGSDVVQIYNNQGKLIDTQQKEAITMSVHNQMNTLYLIAREQSSHSLWSFIEGGTKTLEHRLSITPEGMSSLYGWVAVWGRNQIQVFDQKLNKVLSLDDYYDLRNIHWVAPSLLVIETGQDLVLYNLE